MSRKRIFNINRFDGGIITDIRDASDLSKCAFVSHFDIYRDASMLYPMPGYVEDMNDGSTSDGMKDYNIVAFNAVDGLLLALGTKSDGTGSKVVSKDAPTDASWDLTPTGVTIEGSYELQPGTCLAGDDSNMFWVTYDTGKMWLTKANGATVTDNYTEVSSFVSSNGHKMVNEYAPDGNKYMTKSVNNLIQIDGGTGTDDIKTTGIYLTDLQSGDDVLGILGYRFSPNYTQLLIWDTASSLVDQNIEFGKGRGKALGYIGGNWVVVMDENLSSSDAAYNEEENGQHAFSIKYGIYGAAKQLVRIYGATNTNGKVAATRGQYGDAMLFEARVPQDATPTTYKEGIWAVGPNSQGGLALSLLLDTSSLGSIEAYHTFGGHHFFAHAGDGSISRLDDFTSGTYDETAVYESLVFGADTPNSKNLNGISVLTNDLPSGGSVVVKYRTSTDDSWTTLGTSSTTGTKVHSFTRPSSGMVGTFTEIQFRVEVTGNAPVRNIYVSLEELDTTPYDS